MRVADLHLHAMQAVNTATVLYWLLHKADPTEKQQPTSKTAVRTVMHAVRLTRLPYEAGGAQARMMLLMLLFLRHGLAQDRRDRCFTTT